MGDDNIFTFVLKGIFVLILGFMALAFIIPFITAFDTQIIKTLIGLIGTTFAILFFLFVIATMVGFKK